jgi:hypothetical protein
LASFVVAFRRSFIFGFELFSPLGHPAHKNGVTQETRTVFLEDLQY